MRISQTDEGDECSVTLRSGSKAILVILFVVGPACTCGFGERHLSAAVSHVAAVLVV